MARQSLRLFRKKIELVIMLPDPKQPSIRIPVSIKYRTQKELAEKLVEAQEASIMLRNLEAVAKYAPRNTVKLRIGKNTYTPQRDK